MRLLVCAFPLAAACAATGGPRLEERFHLGGSREQIIAAVSEAGERMGFRRDGWAPEGTVRFVETPTQSDFARSEITAWVDSGGALVLSTPDEWASARGDVRVTGMGIAPRLLVQAAEQVLEPARTRPDARVAEPRSLALALALDLVLPAAGALYARPGDPYTAGDTAMWWAPFMSRLILDGSVGFMLFAGLPGGNPLLMVANAVVMLALLRAYAIWSDVVRILDRNALAASGLKLRLLRDPLQRDPDF
jgi:hypothetical protein